MKTICLSVAAALVALACAACHSEQTREKIANLQSGETENAVTNGVPATANEAQPQ